MTPYALRRRARLQDDVWRAEHNFGVDSLEAEIAIERLIDYEEIEHEAIAKGEAKFQPLRIKVTEEDF